MYKNIFNRIEPCFISLNKSKDNSSKRRIVSVKECEVDLKGVLDSIFKAIDGGIEKYNLMRLFFNPKSKVRGFDAVTLNTAIVESLQESFPENWKWGKYKRFVLRLNNYLFLVKKLNRNGIPMNIKTSHSLGIANQMQLNLFNDESNSISEPIIYIGYQVSDIGLVLNPRLVYIDEGQIKWTITRDDIANSSIGNNYIKEESEEPLVSLKKTSYKEVVNK